MRLLIAEDELDLAEALTAFFEKNQYTVDTVHDGAAAYDHAVTGVYDGIILDIMMPKMDGFAVLKALRSEGCKTPALFLTARSEIEDRIQGLDLGADDYLPKPFHMEELLARIRAMLRRRDTYLPDILRYADLSLNPQNFQLSCKDRSVTLPKLEYQLMETLLRNQGIYLSSEELLTKVWGYDTEAELGIVWVYICYLRKRLLLLGSDTEIRARRSVGYTLEMKK